MRLFFLKYEFSFSDLLYRGLFSRSLVEGEAWVGESGGSERSYQSRESGRSERSYQSRESREGLSGPIRQGIGLIRLWMHRSRSRKQLASMEDRLLSDIGINRNEALRQYGKWFWQE